MVFGKFSQMRKASKSKTEDEFVSQRPLIHVIDDDMRIRQGLKLNLQKTYRIRLSATGEEGIEAVDEEVSVVILDIKMPGKNGLQVYDAINLFFK